MFQDWPGGFHGARRESGLPSDGGGWGRPVTWDGDGGQDLLHLHGGEEGDLLGDMRPPAGSWTGVVRRLEMWFGERGWRLVGRLRRA